MLDATALAVFVFFFALVTVLGFVAARWRRGDLNELAEWGLGGRRFGLVVSWFLIGGDLYTAYTLIAVPALMFGSGALGFFAIPYAVLAYPIMLLFVPRLWNVCKRHNLVTPADFVRARFGSDGLALAIALTGIVALMPYIALQLIGIKVVIATMGVGGTGFRSDLPLIFAFVILAAYTYTSGLRAPALIAFVKDAMIYVTVIAAVVAVPLRLGGFAPMFAAAQAHFAALARTAGHGAAGSVLLGPPGYWPYATLALGSALALFMYPHALTGVLSSRSVGVVRRNAALLPAYSFLLGLIALLAFGAIALGIKTNAPSLAIPLLLRALFPSWFVGFAFASIAIAALVPAAVMSIAAANLWTRNIYKAYLRRDASDAQQARIAKFASLVVKLGALAFIIGVPTRYAINLQLLGGIWILQTFPAVALGVYTRWFHPRALLGGWLAAIVAGTLLAFSQGGVKATFPISLGGATFTIYIALEALALNLLVAAALTYVFAALKTPRGTDATAPGDYATAG